MVAAKSNARGRRDSRDRNGGVAVSGGPVPELAVIVGAPALHRAVRQHGTRVVPAQSDARRRCDSRDRNGGGPVGGGPAPELAIIVATPALHLPVRQRGTRVGSTQSNLHPLNAK